VNEKLSRTRLLMALVFAVLLPACTGGINAGVDGGAAFIAFAGMLIVFCVILWLAIGRED
jgi:hypothetical protein